MHLATCAESQTTKIKRQVLFWTIYKKNKHDPFFHVFYCDKKSVPVSQVWCTVDCGLPEWFKLVSFTETFLCVNISHATATQCYAVLFLSESFRFLFENLCFCLASIFTFRRSASAQHPAGKGTNSRWPEATQGQKHHGHSGVLSTESTFAETYFYICLHRHCKKHFFCGDNMKCMFLHLSRATMVQVSLRQPGKNIRKHPARCC